ncbi:hypothetical protein BSM4216_2310 [Bacillus smithii]|jgi:hypothetical protein|nr:hypothetical protein BSM4216_2310 [Bacillus smithii]
MERWAVLPFHGLERRAAMQSAMADIFYEYWLLIFSRFLL